MAEKTVAMYQSQSHRLINKLSWLIYINRNITTFKIVEHDDERIEIFYQESMSDIWTHAALIDVVGDEVTGEQEIED